MTNPHASPTTSSPQSPILAGDTAWEMLKTNVSAHGALGTLPFEKQRALWIEVASKLAKEVTGESVHEVVPLGGATQGLAKVRSWLGFRILTASKGENPGDELLVVRFSKAKDNRGEIVPAPFPGEGSGAIGDELVKRFSAQYRAACGANPLDRLRPHVIILFNDLTRPIHPYMPEVKDRLKKYWPQIGGGLAVLAVAWWMIGGVASCAHNYSVENAKEKAQKAAYERQLAVKLDERKEAGKNIAHPRISFAFQNLDNEALLRHLYDYLPPKGKEPFSLSPKDAVYMLELLPKNTAINIQVAGSVENPKVRPLNLVVSDSIINAITPPITSEQATSLYRSVEVMISGREIKNLEGNPLGILNEFSLKIAEKFVVPAKAEEPPAKEVVEPKQKAPPVKSEGNKKK